MATSCDTTTLTNKSHAVVKKPHNAACFASSIVFIFQSRTMLALALVLTGLEAIAN